MDSNSNEESLPMAASPGSRPSTLALSAAACLPGPAPAMLAAELQKLNIYVRANSQTVLEAFPGVRYREAGLLLAASQDPGLRAVGLWAVARSLDERETVSIGACGAVELSKLQLFVESLRCDSTFSHAYCSLGVLAYDSHSPVTLHDGCTLSQRQLYLEALRCDPNSSRAYYNLGVDLTSTETVVLHDGRTLSKRQLYLESLRCDPSNSHAYDSLANVLSSTRVVLHDGRTLTKRQLYLEALRCNHNNLQAYHNLAGQLSSTETVVLHDGRTLSKKQLYLEALRCDPKNSISYSNLGLGLTSRETVVLHDGRTLSQRQLLLESLRCDPTRSKVREWLERKTPSEEAWTRRGHTLLFGSKTNTLFATLLLGVQRLEEAGVLLLAHQAMLEDMLECWTWGDTKDLGMLGTRMHPLT